MAGNRWPPPGLHNVGSYQVSGVPWITGSEDMTGNQEHKIKFPYVTQNVTVLMLSPATDGILRVHFASKNSAGVLNGYHEVPLNSAEDSVSFNVKCTKLYLSTPAGGGTRKYRVIAELTNIPSGSMHALTGSGISSHGPDDG